MKPEDGSMTTRVIKKLASSELVSANDINHTFSNLGRAVAEWSKATKLKKDKIKIKIPGCCLTPPPDCAIVKKLLFSTETFIYIF